MLLSTALTYILTSSLKFARRELRKASLPDCVSVKDAECDGSGFLGTYTSITIRRLGVAHQLAESVVRSFAIASVARQMTHRNQPLVRATWLVQRTACAAFTKKSDIH